MKQEPPPTEISGLDERLSRISHDIYDLTCAVARVGHVKEYELLMFMRVKLQSREENPLTRDSGLLAVVSKRIEQLAKELWGED